MIDVLVRIALVANFVMAAINITAYVLTGNKVSLGVGLLNTGVMLLLLGSL